MEITCTKKSLVRQLEEGTCSRRFASRPDKDARVLGERRVAGARGWARSMRAAMPDRMSCMALKLSVTDGMRMCARARGSDVEWTRGMDMEWTWD